jgi:hypothetical protein
VRSSARICGDVSSGSYNSACYNLALSTANSLSRAGFSLLCKQECTYACTTRCNETRDDKDGAMRRATIKTAQYDKRR